MNIFDLYLEKIKNLLFLLNKNESLTLPKNLNNLNVDIPPSNFKCDISTNVAMILAKPNNQSPLELAKKLTIHLEKDENIEKIDVAKPGFINIKLTTLFWSNFLKDVLANPVSYGAKKDKNKKKIFS